MFRNSSRFVEKNKAFIALGLLYTLFCGWIFPVAGASFPTADGNVILIKENLPKPIQSSNSKRLPEAVSKKQAENAIKNMPFRFEINQGQIDKGVNFLSRGNGYSFLLTRDEAILNLGSSRAQNSLKPERGGTTRKGFNEDTQLRMKLVGARSDSRVEGLDALQARTNYFIGKDANRWRRNVSSYERVKYQGIYPGIDLIYYGKGQNLEYDFVIAPGADPGIIKMKFKGAERIEKRANGELILQTPSGEVRYSNPLIYQETEGVKRQISGGYVTQDRGEVSFQIDNFDRTKPLVIDPVVAYSTLLGDSKLPGNGLPRANGAAIFEDAVGTVFVYIAGQSGDDFQTTNNAYQRLLNGGSNAGGSDAYIAKLKMEDNGQASLIYLTYFGGSNWEGARDIAVDSQGNAYITGHTNSNDLPQFRNLPNSSNAAGYCAPFVAKFSSDGSSLGYSSYFGTSGVDNGGGYCTNSSPTMGHGIAVDSSGNAYVTGSTASANFPTTANAYQPNKPGGAGRLSAFVAKLIAPSETGPISLGYSTYLSGTTSGGDVGRGIAVDSAGNAYVSGFAQSRDFPTKNAAQSTNRTHSYYDFDATAGTVFVAKLNTLAYGDNSLAYSTYLGGSAIGISNSQVAEFDSGIAVDSAGYIYVTGYTVSADFPTTADAFQKDYRGQGDAFITKLNPFADGPRILYSTYLGGTGSDFWFEGGGGLEASNGIAVDANGNAYVTGITNSYDFPTKNSTNTSGNGMFQSVDGGGTWLRINNGLTNPNIKSIAIDESRSPRTLYAGTATGVFKSEDGGIKWSAANAGIADLEIGSLAVDPVTPDVIYAATPEGVYRSTDAGFSWNQLNAGLTNEALTSVNTFKCDVNTVNGVPVPTIYIGTNAGLYRLTGGVNAWGATGNDNAIANIAIDPRTSPHSVYTASPMSGGFKSTDSGATWNSVPSPYYYLGAIEVDDSSTPSTLLALGFPNDSYEVQPSLFKSMDGGTSWQELPNPGFTLQYENLSVSIQVDKTTSPSTIYINSPSALVRGAVGSADWTNVPYGGGGFAIDSASTNSPVPVYAGTPGFNTDLFITELNATGSGLIFSTLLGGSGQEMGFAIALDKYKNIYVTGFTTSQDFPLVNPYQSDHPGAYAVFLTKLGSQTLPATSAGAVTTGMQVQTGTLELTLPNIQDTDLNDSLAPTTSVEPLDDSTLTNLTVSNNLGAYEISVNRAIIDTTGYFGTNCSTIVSGATVPVPCWEKHGIKIAFTVPAVNDEATFNNLVISHGEDTDNNPASPLVLVPYDQPLGSSKHTYKDFASRTIWVYTPSLSPFVILKGASDQIADLFKLTHSFNLKQGIQSSLDAKLQNAIKAYQAAKVNDKATTCNVMKSFASEVQSQSGKAITSAQAQRLLNSAKQIRVVLGCI